MVPLDESKGTAMNIFWCGIMSIPLRRVDLLDGVQSSLSDADLGTDHNLARQTKSAGYPLTGQFLRLPVVLDYRYALQHSTSHCIENDVQVGDAIVRLFLATPNQSWRYLKLEI
nr:hypothetical protein CFP56_39016 [Quercus suber]